MRSLLLFAGLLLSVSAFAADESHTVVGELEIRPFASKIFANTRDMRVLLPPGYHDMVNRHRKYPVMYFQDGQNLFDEETSAFGHEWEIDETLQRLCAENEIEPMIIIGIDNAGEQRAEEYLPYPDPHGPKVAQLRATDYGNFLLQEVMPYVETHYRVKAGPENTGIGGSSYGAVVSLFTILHHPGVFGRALLESMPLQMQDGQLIRDAQNFRQWPQKIAIGIGTKETDDPAFSAEHVEWTRKLARVLRDQSLGDDRLKLVVTPGAEHNEKAWAARFPEAILFLWGKPPAAKPLGPAAPTHCQPVKPIPRATLSLCPRSPSGCA